MMEVRYGAYPTRVKSELQVGAGYFDIFHSTGNLKNLYGKKCQYGLTVTRANFCNAGVL